MYQNYHIFFYKIHGIIKICLQHFTINSFAKTWRKIAICLPIYMFIYIYHNFLVLNFFHSINIQMTLFFVTWKCQKYYYFNKCTLIYLQNKYFFKKLSQIGWSLFKSFNIKFWIYINAAKNTNKLHNSK